MLRNKYYVYGDNLQIPSHIHFGQEMLERMIENEDLIALINADTNEKLTYGELAQSTVDIALSLTRMGVRKGDVVSVCSEKRFEVLATVMGAICAGATFSPTDVTYGTAPLLHRVRIAKPKIMFCSPAALKTHKKAFDTVGCIEKYIIYSDQLETSKQPQTLHKHNELSFNEFLIESANVEDFIPVPVDGWMDYVLILFSSGTTGLPKGVPHTHLGVIINSSSISIEGSKGESLLNTREWYYTYGLLNCLSSLRQGMTIVYTVKNTQEYCLAAIQKYQIKYLQMTPALVAELTKSSILDNYDVSSVEGIVSSSTPIMAEQVDAVKRRLPRLRNVYQIYGTSEAGGVCNEMHAPLGPKGGSVGIPSHSFVLKVVDLKTRQPVGPGVRGEIYFKSPCLTPGYLDVPHRDYIDEEGFYKTGDVGYYDEDQYFFILNRVKELIKYNDYSIAPAEIESLLLKHPAIKEAGVVGAPSEEHGEAPTAFVVLQRPAEEQEIVAFLENMVTFRWRLAGGVRFVEQLPWGPGGKLDRDALKSML